MDIKSIKAKVRDDDYFYSLHADNERKNDELSILEIEEAILNGRILEDYEDTGRGESCLIVGFSNNGKPIHIVSGYNSDRMVIITVYIPTSPKFKTPYERG